MKQKRKPRYGVTKHRGSRCKACDEPAIPGNPLYPDKQMVGKYLHLNCGGKR